VPYYLLANLCGALLLSFLLVGIVYSTLKELQSGYEYEYDPSKERGLLLLLRKGCSLIAAPIKNMPLVAEPTGQFRKAMHECSEHIVYKIGVCLIIIIASIAMVR